jgi:hypothetical protein
MYAHTHARTHTHTHAGAILPLLGPDRGNDDSTNGQEAALTGAVLPILPTSPMQVCVGFRLVRLHGLRAILTVITVPYRICLRGEFLLRPLDNE